ncbi:MAG: acyl-CoA dehydrogenase [Acidimicrobiia bacterium]
MDLELSDEQTALVDLFTSIAERNCAPETVRLHETLGFAPMLWSQVVAAGGPGIAIPEANGGGGAGLLELALAVTVFGQYLAPVPLVEHVVAARLLARVSGDLPDGVVPHGVVDGTTIATIALRPAVDGMARLVPAGAVAHLLLALEGDDLLLVTTDPPGVAVPNLASAPLAHRAIAGGTVVASGAVAHELYETGLAEWRALTAAALAGLGRGALELARTYVTERQQFGKPIGSFQAIQHTLADVTVALDGAQLLARKAAWAFDSDHADAPDLAAMAFLFASEQAQRASERALHFHGGYGYMQEYDIQLYYRRAKGWPLVLDAPVREYRRLAAHRYGSPTGAR